ncbi:hypothetical protein AVEN_49013-1 [Araneus ventricosus]|uniref:Uncharacterized protein n=1 Tax=Araneus ventricosus TaxID=182803 RepID=A0A4Y2AGT1_ARAVE|nr:hypothetical protein AVEN_49013-1 [Araneus ventricosus]
MPLMQKQSVGVGEGGSSRVGGAINDGAERSSMSSSVTVAAGGAGVVHRNVLESDVTACIDFFERSFCDALEVLLYSWKTQVLSDISVPNIPGLSCDNPDN